MPSSGASSARHIAGADALGEANDEEVRGSVDVVTMRRVDSRRRKAEAIQAQLEKIKPLSKAPAPVPAAALAADLAALERSGGIAAKTAGKVATDERTLDQFLEEREQRLDEGMYPSRETMVEFAAHSVHSSQVREIRSLHGTAESGCTSVITSSILITPLH